MHIVVGVVAEGPTDVVTLRAYLEAWLHRLDESITLETRALQPQVDATSGRLGRGGWSLVKAWCANNTPEDRAIEYFAPFFEGTPPVDVLLVQLDADVIDEYAAPYADIAVPPNPDAAARGAIVDLILERWLWQSAHRRSADPHEGRHCLVATVRALETWIIAGLDRSILNPEEVENPERELMRLEPGLPTRRTGSVRRLRKTESSWQGLARKTCTELDHIKSACPHCARFLAYFEAVVEEA